MTDVYEKRARDGRFRSTRPLDKQWAGTWQLVDGRISVRDGREWRFIYDVWRVAPTEAEARAWVDALKDDGT